MHPNVALLGCVLLALAALSCGDSGTGGVGVGAGAGGGEGPGGGAGGAACEPRVGAGGASDGGVNGSGGSEAVTVGSGGGINLDGGSSPLPAGRLKCYDPETGAGFVCEDSGKECCEKKDVCWEPAIEPSFCDLPYCE